MWYDTTRGSRNKDSCRPMFYPFVLDFSCVAKRILWNHGVIVKIKKRVCDPFFGIFFIPPAQKVYFFPRFESFCVFDSWLRQWLSQIFRLKIDLLKKRGYVFAWFPSGILFLKTGEK